MSGESEKHVRKMTAKGQQDYDERRNELFQLQERAWDQVEEMLSQADECCPDLQSLRKLEKNISVSVNKFTETTENYKAFLIRHSSYGNEEEQKSQRLETERRISVINKVKDQIKTLKNEALDTISVSSKGSRGQRSSSSGDTVQKRSKVEVERTKLHFVEQKARLLKQKAEIDANITVLEQQSEAAVAEAEAEVFEHYESKDRISASTPSIVGDSIVDKRFRTQQFVNQQQEFMKVGHTSDYRVPTKNVIFNQTEIPQNSNLNHYNIPVEPSYRIANDRNIYQPDSRGLVSAPPIRDSQNNIVQDITTFLLKKDLLLSRFTKFEDRPETFVTWKTSFQEISRELCVTPSEELDLLVKWLGPESSRFALTIRSSNATQPLKALDKIWERLHEQYGRPEMIESSLKTKLENFPKISGKDPKKYYELLDILSEIESAKENYLYSTLLSYFDSSSGIKPVLNKLPYGIQEKWISQASKYKTQRNVPFPPFSFFVQFIKEISSIKNDPAFSYEQSVYSGQSSKKDAFTGKFISRSSQNVPTAIARKFEIENTDNKNLKRCPLHKANHSLNECRAFKSMNFHDRKQFLMDKKLCFNCLMSTDHTARNCPAPVQKQVSHGGEHPVKDSETVASKCTKLCGYRFRGRSCGKIIPVKVFPKGQFTKAVNVYAIIDDQSNRTLAGSELFDKLDVQGSITQYKLSCCAGNIQTSGRRASDLSVCALDNKTVYDLPDVLECNEIPNDRSEIPTPEVARHFLHLNKIMDNIPPLDDTVDIQLLIGRDLTEVHHVHEQITGPRGTPFAQRLSLGWVIVGDVCLGKVHKPSSVTVNKTQIIKDGRGTIFEPCENCLFLKEYATDSILNCDPQFVDTCGNSVFERKKDDDKVGLSIEDRQFLNLMEREFYKNDNGNWVAPLPFKNENQYMPNNKLYVWNRAKALDTNLRKNPTKKEHFVTFMQKILDNGAAELAPPTNSDKCWYLPIFGIYHPKKPHQIRGVFDSSAVFQGISLNSVLMSGPDLANSLLGVLIRFRKDSVAVTADIEQMFYQFYVKEEHRDYLRFFWYKDNNPDLPMTEYRMRVHVFGNKPSPAVASYGLRRTVENCDKQFNKDVKKFVHENFYVDDGLTSLATSEQAIDLMCRTQKVLKTEGNIRLHKITSNSLEVMDAFPREDISKNLKNVLIGEDSLLVQHSLGLCWDLHSDKFIFDISSDDKPYTRRGLLSTVNSIYDPLGFLAPVTISGKILLRSASPPGTDWDEPLSRHEFERWDKWRRSSVALENLRIPRMYSQYSLSLVDSVELHIFSDASEEAIAAVAYLKTIKEGHQNIGFIFGKSKLAPSKGHSIPRLELCAAVLATEVGALVLEHLDLSPLDVKYYTDSKVVLGYINNQKRRFFNYVSNRVEKILKVSKHHQWHYVNTNNNPADSSTRCCLSSFDSKLDTWLFGASWLCSQHANDFLLEDVYPLIDPENDSDVKPVNVETCKTTLKVTESLEIQCFDKFSTWKSLIKAISLLQHLAKTFSQKNELCKGWHLCTRYKTVDSLEYAKIFVLKQVQKNCFSKEIECLKESRVFPKDSPILNLSPFLDSDGLLRVGGRLNKLENILETGELNPIILPKGHVSTLIIDHYHSTVRHQGRFITEGALRKGGFWLLGAKRMISSFINKCVTCRKLRGKIEHQKMSDLPIDRITPGPPFTSVGVDTFGPWQVVTRKTRGGVAHNKRWAILFTCLTTRAVHIELVEELSSSSFINALRRFISVRGPVKLFRSDRGTNFIGATDDLKINSVNVEDGQVKSFLIDSECTWIFNAPHSSHMGGVWERMIGITRRIFDSMLLSSSVKTLTHESLTTFMAEVCAIINSRPIAEISSDPESPIVLSPSMLLTGKVGYLPVISEGYSMKDMYRAQWKHVQVLSDMFWKQWRCQYLNSLQTRRKWASDHHNLKAGDVVLIVEKQLPRFEWPIGVVVKAIVSDDGKVRKACVRIHKDNKNLTYTRPITEMVLLVD